MFHVSCFMFHVSCCILHITWDARTTRTAQLSVVLSSSVSRTSTSHENIVWRNTNKRTFKIFRPVEFILAEYCCIPLVGLKLLFHCLSPHDALIASAAKFQATGSLKMIVPSIIALLAFQLCTVSSYQLSSKRMQVTMVSSNPFGGFLNNMKQPSSSAGKLFSSTFH